MRVILLRDISKVGKKLDDIEVADGYANNFLFPRKLAVQATPAKIAEFSGRREAERAARDAEFADLKEKLSAIDGTVVTISAKADEQGHLFKKVRAADVSVVLKDEQGVSLEPDMVLLEEPITELGEQAVSIEAAGLRVTVTVTVVRE